MSTVFHLLCMKTAVSKSGADPAHGLAYKKEANFHRHRSQTGAKQGPNLWEIHANQTSRRAGKKVRGQERSAKQPGSGLFPRPQRWDAGFIHVEGAPSSFKRRKLCWRIPVIMKQFQIGLWWTDSLLFLLSQLRCSYLLPQFQSPNYPAASSGGAAVRPDGS